MKFKYVVQFLLITLVVPAFAANGAMKGNGSAENPFEIEDYGDLKAIGKGAYLYSLNYILTKDIDASASKKENCNGDVCKGFSPIGRNKDAADSTYFKGSFDGQNHTIRNLFVQGTGDELGLISLLRGSVKNLKLDSVNVMGATTSSRYVGGVVGFARGPIENVHVTNSFIQGHDNVGGIAGAHHESSSYMYDVSYQGEVKAVRILGGIAGSSHTNISNAVANARIVVVSDKEGGRGSFQVGGIAGYAEISIRDSRSSGVIVPNAQNISSVGGLVGESRSDIYYCTSSVDLLSASDSGKTYVFDDRIGGLVGDNRDPIFWSYATGNVEGTSNVGGLVGANSNKIELAYVQGSVKGEEYVGGLVGRNTTESYGNIHDSGSVKISYAGNKVVGKEESGGLVGFNNVDTSKIQSSYWDKELSGLDSSDGGTGLRTKEMMTMSSFEGWDALGGWDYTYCDNNACDAFDSLGKCLCRYRFVSVWGIDEGKSYPYFSKYDSAEVYDPKVYLGYIYTERPTVRIQNQTLAKSHSFGAKFQGGDIAVQFEIPTAGSVKFSLVDMQGRVVKMADLGSKAAGSYFETIGVDNLSRGRYVGVLHVNGKAVQKTTLLKK